MKQKRIFLSHKKKLIFLILGIGLIVAGFLIAVIFQLAVFYDSKNFGQAFAGSVGAVATLIGSLLIIYQLGAERNVNCAQMLSDLNFRFIENERFMLMYREFEKAYKDPTYDLDIDNSDPNKIHDEDLMAYFTFYESLNEFINHNVMTIEQMNDLFGDRFFKFVHNRDVQERELFAEPSSYVNIFELYGRWMDYRQKCEEKGISRISVRKDLKIPKSYYKDKLYLEETTRILFPKEEKEFINSKGEKVKLTYRRLFPKDIKSCMSLQDEVIKELVDGGHKDMFFPTYEEEFFESYLIDYCYGLFAGDELVAASIFVLNRKSNRNLCDTIASANDFHDYLTFDMVQVKKEYRGYKIHDFYLKEAEKVADICGAKNIIATIAPDNEHSKANFEKCGFNCVATVRKYADLERNIFLKKL